MSTGSSDTRMPKRPKARRRMLSPETVAMVDRILQWDPSGAIKMLEELKAEPLDDEGVTWDEFKANLEANRRGQRKLFRD